jgi:hypothetical protein
MSGVEGAEREDYHDGEAGVERASGVRQKRKSINHRGHGGSQRKSGSELGVQVLF